jgi:integrase
MQMRMRMLMALCRMNRSDLTMHGFRSTFRDWAAESTSYPREVCEQALSHNRQDKAEAAYFRSDLFDKRRAMMEEWAEYACLITADKKQISGP